MFYVHETGWSYRRLNRSKFSRKIFAGGRENRKTFHPAKLSSYTVHYIVFLNWLLSLYLTLCFRLVGGDWPGFTHTRTETSTTQVGEYRTWTSSLLLYPLLKCCRRHPSPIFWWWWSSEEDARAAAGPLHHHLEEHCGCSQESWCWRVSTGRWAGRKILSQWVHQQQYVIVL